MKDKDELIKHGTIMFIATVLSGILNYAFHIVMVRMLGPADYGILFSLTSLFMIVSLPSNTIQTIISKYISTFRARKEYGKMSYLLMRFLKKMSGMLGVLFVLFVFSSKLIAGFLNIPLIMPVIMIGIILYFGLLFTINFGALQGLERFTPFAYVQIIGAGSRLLFGIVFVYIGWRVNGALLASLISCFFILISAQWYVRDVWSIRPYDEKIESKAIYKYFIPVSIAYICYGIATYIDVIFVKHYFQPLEAGYYSAASMIGRAFLFAPMAFAGAMFPKVSGHFEKGSKTRHLLYKTLVYSIIICAAGVAICIFFARPLISLLLRKTDITQETYNVMVPLLYFIGFAITPYGLACIVINYYLARRWYKFLPYLIAALVLQIILLISFHNSLIQVLTVLFITGIFILFCGVPARIYERIKVK